MELTRTLSHLHASSSGLLRPTRASTNAIARVPVARRALRLSVRPSAVASFAAPNASSVGAAPQKADTVVDVSLRYQLHVYKVLSPLVVSNFPCASITHPLFPLNLLAGSLC